MSQLDQSQLEMMTKAQLLDQIVQEIKAWQLNPAEFRFHERMTKEELLGVIYAVRSSGELSWEGEELKKPSLWEMMDAEKEAAKADQPVVEEKVTSDDWDDVVEQPEAEVAPAKPKKERAPKKEKAPKAEKAPRTRRYTVEEVARMRELIASGMTKAKVAKEFGCSSTFIHNVLTGRVYKDLA